MEGKVRLERPAADEKRYVREQAVATFLDVSVKTLQRWRLAGDGPRFRKLGGRKTSKSPVRYDLRDVETWMESQDSGGAQ